MFNETSLKIMFSSLMSFGTLSCICTLDQRFSNFYNLSTTYIYGKKHTYHKKKLFQLYVYLLIKKSQCEVWICLSEHIRPISGCISVRCNLRSGSRFMRALNFVLILTMLPKMPTYFFTYWPTYHYDLCDVPLVVRVPQFEKRGTRWFLKNLHLTLRTI